MARAGMLQRGRNTGAEGVDDVQRSLELLDKVLSEFDEGDPLSLPSLSGGAEAEGAAPAALQAAVTPADSAAVSSTPDDDSPSLGGHQSEDDGYMSMNGRRAKFALSFRPTEEKGEPAVVAADRETPLSPSRSDLVIITTQTAAVESPPPPEEAERIISTLLPKVSPANSVARNPAKHEIQKPYHLELVEVNSKAINTATQTTLPKTRHQRPFGWDKSPQQPIGGFPHQQPSNAPCRFASLPNGAKQPVKSGPNPSWLPVRQDIKYDRNTTITNPHCLKKSPSGEMPKTSFPAPNTFAFPNEFVCGNKPYNEHPVTIYPGANVPYTKQLHSPTYGLPRNGPLSASYSARTSPHAADNFKKHNSRRDFKSDGEILSPVHRMPPRTLAGSMEKHREVCRGPLDDQITSTNGKKSTTAMNDEEHFSDDSLEESLPPPPPIVTPSKRSSIAWEVSLDDDNLLTPGSTKVIGRRRRKSGDSSSGSIPHRVDDSSSEWISVDQDGEYWPPPPLNCSTEDEMHSSPFSDAEQENSHLPSDIAEINSTGTYVIRRGKNRKHLPGFAKSSNKSNKHSANSLNSTNTENSIDDSNVSGSGSVLSGSHNSGSSLNSRLSSDLSLPQARFSTDMNNSPRYSKELMMPNSRYSVDLTTPQSRYGKELTSPKSRLSLDLNNSQERHLSREFFNDSPRNKKLQVSEKHNRPSIATNKLSPQNKFTDFKKYSSTFDNIQSLIKESIVQDSALSPKFEESPAEVKIIPPNVVRVVSLPSLSGECDAISGSTRQPLITTVEEEEDQDSGEQQSSGSSSPLRKIENNISAILSHGRDQKHFSPQMPKDWDIHKDEYADSKLAGIKGGFNNYSSKERSKRSEIQKSSSHNAIPTQRSVERHERSSYRKNGIQKSISAKEMPHILNRQTSSSDSTSSCGDFPIHVQVVDHSFRTHPLPATAGKSSHEFGPLPKSPDSPKFPPLPPSPVQEDDEYSEILQTIDKSRGTKKADTLPTSTSDIYFRSEEPPEIPPHRDHTTNSLKTRSMDTSFSKNRRHNGSNKHISSDRRTLPTDISAGGARRRTLQRQNREATPPGSRLNAPLQTSASLPETPIFARGCDVPRTPLRQTVGSMVPRQSNTMNSIQTMSGNSTLGGYGRGSTLSGSLMGTGLGVDRALTGAELLRLAGGPARGWYPKQRHRPASIEHLDHLAASASSASQHGPLWDGSASRKPLTLPPNLTPKFFHKSPREALRRVTSLLIRKGNNGKESKKDKEAVSPAAHSANGDEHSGQKQRKGFFRTFWKKSRHYSLEHP